MRTVDRFRADGNPELADLIEANWCEILLRRGAAEGQFVIRERRKVVAA